MFSPSDKLRFITCVEERMVGSASTAAFDKAGAACRAQFSVDYSNVKTCMNVFFLKLSNSRALKEINYNMRLPPKLIL
jgi:hypothetical protein